MPPVPRIGESRPPSSESLPSPDDAVLVGAVPSVEDPTSVVVGVGGGTSR